MTLHSTHPSLFVYPLTVKQNMPQCLEKLRRIVTVEPAIFFYMTSTFIMLPAYQRLVMDKVSVASVPLGYLCPTSALARRGRGREINQTWF